MNGTAISVTPAPVQLPPLFNPNVKDSRWLTLEVCREYTRNKCTRTDQECKFAHPPPHVEVQNGRVTCCFDSIKGKCQRKDPPCKYLHPPQHLKEQLLQNGRNNLILRNLQWQALTSGLQPVVPQALPTVVYDTASTNGKSAGGFPSPLLQAQYPSANFVGPPGYIVSNPAAAAAAVSASMNPYVGNQAGLTNVIQNIDGLGMTSLPVSSLSSGSSTQVPNAMVTGATPTTMAQKVARADRLESSTAVSGSSGSVSSTWNGHPAHGSPTESSIASHYNHPVYFQPTQVVEVMNTTSKKRPRDPTDDLILSMNPVPGMVPIVKRTAMDGKAGVAMYPSAGAATATYQQALAAMQIQQQPYVPVTIAGHPPGVPRF